LQPKPETLAKFEALRAAYSRDLPAKLNALVEAWESLSAQPDSTDLFEAFRRIVHNMAGTAGTFGFNALGEAARELDLFHKSHTHLKSDAIEQTQNLLNQIMKAGEIGTKN
jgi:chemotaxis protein histidine kinase CheA